MAAVRGLAGEPADPALREVVRVAVDVTRARAGAIVLDADGVGVVAAHGDAPDDAAWLDLTARLAVEAAEGSSRVVVLADPPGPARAGPERSGVGSGTGSALGSPLRGRDGRPLGALLLIDPAGAELAETQRDALAALAAQAATHLDTPGPPQERAASGRMAQALHAVERLAAAAPGADPHVRFQRLLTAIATGLGWPAAHLVVADHPGALRSSGVWSRLDDDRFDQLVAATAAALPAAEPPILRPDGTTATDPVVRRHLHRDPAFAPRGGRPPVVRTGCAVPLALDGELLGALELFTDADTDLSSAQITYLRRVGTALERVVGQDRHRVVDGLTGALTRAGIVDALAARARSASPLGIVVADIDRFQEVNHRHGRVVGDAVLIAVTRSLRAAIPADCTLGRPSSDEFVVICPRGEAEAVEVAEAIAARCRTPLDVSVPAVDAAVTGHTGGRTAVSLTCSIGVAARAGGDVEDGERVWLTAEGAARTAKARGGAQIVVGGTELLDREIRIRELRDDLAHALGRGQIRIELQPIVAIGGGEVTGFEALMRWTHPDRGVVPPDQFIPWAEQAGTIHELGRWAIEEVCRVGSRWEHELGHSLSLSVNVSMHQLQSPGFADVVDAALRETGFSAPLLTLEITESSLMEDPATAGAALLQLKALGVRIAIDDFGTGYSSLEYLHRLPVDRLKLDRGFVKRLPGDGTVVARKILELARELDLDVVAEGVETVIQRNWLLERGCEHAQGWLYARALPLEEALEVTAAPLGPAPDAWRPLPPTPPALSDAPAPPLARVVSAAFDGAPAGVLVLREGRWVLIGSSTPLTAPSRGCAIALDEDESITIRPGGGPLEDLGVAQADAHALVVLADDSGDSRVVVTVLADTAESLEARRDRLQDVRVATQEAVLRAMMTSRAARAEAHVLARQEHAYAELAGRLDQGPIQRLTVVRLLLDGLAREHPPTPAMAAAISALEEASVQLRHLVADHRGVRTVPELVSALTDLARTVDPAATVDTSIEPESAGAFEPHVNTLYRMGRQLLANVSAHAGGALSNVALVLGRRQGLLQVVDRGPGGCPPTSPPGSYGLDSVRYRAQLLGGRMTVGSGPGGTTVRIVVPAPVADVPSEA